MHEHVLLSDMGYTRRAAPPRQQNQCLQSCMAALAKLQHIEFDHDEDEAFFREIDERLWDLVDRIENGEF